MSSPQEPGKPGAESSEALEQQIKEFFRGVAVDPPERLLCDRCGKEMGWMVTTFSLYGTDSAWRVRVPVCDCDRTNRFLEPFAGSATERGVS